MGIFGNSDESSEEEDAGSDSNPRGDDNPFGEGALPENRELYHSELLKQAIRVTIETGAGTNNLQTLVSDFVWQGDRLTLKRPVRVTPKMSYEQDSHSFHLESNIEDTPFVTMDMSEYGDVHYTLHDFVLFQSVVMVNTESDWPAIEKWRARAAFTEAVDEERLTTKTEQMEFLEEFGDEDENEE